MKALSRCSQLALLLSSCASQTSYGDLPPTWSRERISSVHSQALIGISEVSGIELSRESSDISRAGKESLPAVGAAWQMPMTYSPPEIGIETGVSLGWDAGRSLRVSDGQEEMSVDTNLLIADIWIGPYIALPLGRSVRVYASAGPLLQYGEISLRYEQQNGDLVRVRDNSYAGGTYVRTGIELIVARDVYLGFGARWYQSVLDLDASKQAIDINVAQYFFTLSTRF